MKETMLHIGGPKHGHMIVLRAGMNRVEYPIDKAPRWERASYRREFFVFGSGCRGLSVMVYDGDDAKPERYVEWINEIIDLVSPVIEDRRIKR